MQIINHRGALERTVSAIERGRLTVGFIGGSITAFVDYRSWTEPVLNWLVSSYPSLRVISENAGIEGTGSDLACFRAERDIISRNCDIVFVEFAVNDVKEPREKRERSREGLIRKLLKAGIDVVIVYTYSGVMLEDMLADKVPELISDFEKLAVHYNIGSVWMGKYALNEVKRGMLRWEEWLPDGIHPRERGSLCYAQPVIQYLCKELQRKEQKSLIPEPYNKKNWENASVLSFDEVEFHGPWRIRRSTSNTFMDQIIDTSAIGSKLSFSFYGTGVYIGLDYGSLSAAFRWRIDGGEWSEVTHPLPTWVGQTGWFHLAQLAYDLESGKHDVEIESVLADCEGSRFNLALIGVI